MPIVLESFTKLHDAYFARMHLDIEGIDSFLFDEYIVGVHPFYSNAVGGVKLAVHKSDFEKANDIIKKYREEQLNNLYARKRICPNCKSTDIRNNTFLFLAIFVICIFTIGIFGILFYKKNKCKKCGHWQSW